VPQGHGIERARSSSQAQGRFLMTSQDKKQLNSIFTDRRKRPPFILKGEGIDHVRCSQEGGSGSRPCQGTDSRLLVADMR